MSPMILNIINPLGVPDWDDQLLKNEDYCPFHSSAWARVLNKSYGYKPLYFVSCEDEGNRILIPFMEINSPLTGRRGVSLPFTDYCPPLAQKKDCLKEAYAFINDYGSGAGWEYSEWRDGSYFDGDACPYESFFTHDLDLTKSEAELFSLLKASNRRNIRKAKKQPISVQSEASYDSLRSFYRLHCLTRRRHGLPPQPYGFFANVYKYLISPGYGDIIIAFESGTPIAAAIFFHFGKRAIFKYGASDANFWSSRPNNLILWEAMVRYKEMGIENLNLGRTATSDPGLLRFKRSWGGVESTLRYYRLGLKGRGFLAKRTEGHLRKSVFSRAPIGILRIIGGLFYKHVG